MHFGTELNYCYDSGLRAIRVHLAGVTAYSLLFMLSKMLLSSSLEIYGMSVLCLWFRDDRARLFELWESAFLRRVGAECSLGQPTTKPASSPLDSSLGMTWKWTWSTICIPSDPGHVTSLHLGHA